MIILLDLSKIKLDTSPRGSSKYTSVKIPIEVRAYILLWISSKISERIEEILLEISIKDAIPGYFSTEISIRVSLKNKENYPGNLSEIIIEISTVVFLQILSNRSPKF